MSPLLKRLAGLLGRAAPTPPAAEDPGAEPERRRRRRGGRGRGGSAAAPPSPPSTPANTTPAPSTRERSSAPRSGNSYDRRRTPRRLDQPLPEDIAFRPPAEGGDRSILPSRRRPPPGLKATKRVLVAGSRFVPRPSTGAEDDEAVLDEHEDHDEATPAATDSSEAEAPARSGRRRRGRRGGRGRRRGGESNAGETPATDEV